MQDDLLFPMLTVEETLMFAAEFRLPRALSKSKKKSRVQASIDQLGIRNAAKTIIGDEAEFYQIILFDQRGAGQSTPHACLVDNTTWDLISDIEKLREHLEISEWQVFGGS